MSDKVPAKSENCSRVMLIKSLQWDFLTLSWILKQLLMHEYPDVGPLLCVLHERRRCWRETLWRHQMSSHKRIISPKNIQREGHRDIFQVNLINSKAWARARTSLPRRISNRFDSLPDGKIFGNSFVRRPWKFGRSRNRSFEAVEAQEGTGFATRRPPSSPTLKSIVSASH